MTSLVHALTETGESTHFNHTFATRFDNNHGLCHGEYVDSEGRDCGIVINHDYYIDGENHYDRNFVVTFYTKPLGKVKYFKEDVIVYMDCILDIYNNDPSFTHLNFDLPSFLVRIKDQLLGHEDVKKIVNIFESDDPDLVEKWYAGSLPRECNGVIRMKERLYSFNCKYDLDGKLIEE
jgi:hypothetical protein